MEGTVQEVLFETRRHASGPFSSNYPPQQQLNEGGRGGLLSYLPFRGITQLKDKWTEYRQPKRSTRLVSLYVSTRGDYVAVALGRQITILQKNNDYQEPVGTFSCGISATFTCGTWSESYELLGVADDTDTIYIVKPNGEEITRITKRQSNISFPIVGLIVQDDAYDKKSHLCTFTAFLSDCSFHDIVICMDPSASIFSAKFSNNVSMPVNSSRDVCCWDYHPKNSLFAVVSIDRNIRSTSNGNPDSCTLSLWRKKYSHLGLVGHGSLDGSYSIPKGYNVQLTSPKVLISPQGNVVATLNTQGCLVIFELDDHNRFLKKMSYHDITDFTWWSDDIFTIAKRNGTITMISISNQINVSNNDLMYSMPILERIYHIPGFVFLLDITSSIQLSEENGVSLVEWIKLQRPNSFDFFKLKWSLVSITQKSVLEVYDTMISSQRFQAALDFADRHGLDKDEVLKSQWLCSVQGVHEIKTILPLIKDQSFVISECVEKVGPTEDAVRTLLSFGLRLTDSYRFSEQEVNEERHIWEFRLARIKMLQFIDRLETFLGINMGRFSVLEYTRFRDLPISKAAFTLAESGKIGALNLLFKRHPYTLTPSTLKILSAIPETVPIQSYGHLLLETSAPSSNFLRDPDWVECEKTVSFINNLYSQDEKKSIQILTEPILVKFTSIQYPSISELSSWYKQRAKDIDTLTGQLDNCIQLIDFAMRKGVPQLERFQEDIFYLHQLIYDSEDELIDFSMSLTDWEKLSDYEKFKLILMGVKDGDVIPRLQQKAVPFMRKRSDPTAENRVDSFLVRWMKEIAAQNKLEMCLIVVEEGCRDLIGNLFFENEVVVIDCSLQCIYLYSGSDKWSTMAAILLKLPQPRDLASENIKKRLKLAEGHVEAGRLLAYYQVPKPISFFMDAHSDEKGVKQIIRLLLSKFIRLQPSRTDHDWANVWRDLQSLQEKAFHFLDLEYMLIEFCRGLLKAGKFSLARSYLKGTSSVALATDKAENLVIQSAREYFFSAPSLACSEIWKAKECLNIFPSSRNVRAESDIIDAVTVRLPNLGVHLLPMAFKQIKNPMEIIKLAITTKTGAYLNADELIEIAKLLGLTSQEEISAVQESIAREAAFAGDVHLAFELCLVLAKKGHGPVWDLCAAIARCQVLDTMDLTSQKLLLGFALSHCDDESIGELLHEWRDLDLNDNCENLITLTGREPSEKTGDFYLSRVTGNLFAEKVIENGKLMSFAESWVPFLLELSESAEFGKRAFVTLLSWLGNYGFTPSDDLIASLAVSIMAPPVSEPDDVIACSVLLNLIDPLYGVEKIEEQLRTRENYHEFSSLMNMGLIYSLLHSYGVEESESPAQRRELLMSKFQEKHKSLSSDEWNNVQSTFWNEWKVKLEQQKHVADRSRALENIIPGVESSRFFSGDMEYIQSAVFSLIESVKMEKKQVLKDALSLAHTYGLDHTKVLLYYLSTILVSEVWSVDDIMEEVSNFKEEILSCASEGIKVISFSVYPAVDGTNKLRLAFIYGLLSDCYMHLQEPHESPLFNDQNSLNLARFCKTVEQECRNVSFIKGLNFKNIAGLQDLNLGFLKTEICAQLDENTLEALATLVRNLVPESLLSWKYLYKHYVLCSLENLEGTADRTNFQTSKDLLFFIEEIKEVYDLCANYISFVEDPGVFDVTKRFLTVILIVNKNSNFSPDLIGKECLRNFISFWLKLMNDLEGLGEKTRYKCLMNFLEIFSNLLDEGIVSPKTGWNTMVNYLTYGLECGVTVETSNFFRSMIFSGCGFEAITRVFCEDLPNLYLSILESILREITSASLDFQSLLLLLSSLSKSEGDSEDLEKVRHAVWDRISIFSDDFHLPNDVRVYILELMQYISGRKKNLEVFSSGVEAVHHLLPWQGWNNFQDRTFDQNCKDVFTLVALKSSQLVSSISPDMEITPRDIDSLDSAVSCFLRVSDSANTSIHVDALLAVLAELEGLFVISQNDSAEALNNSWSNDDDWDEGWESFKEESIEKETKTNDNLSVHPLHICWMAILRKMVDLSSHRDLWKLLDQNVQTKCGILLDEDDTRGLIQTTVEVDCFLALEIALLLPYESLHLQCLNLVEKKLSGGGVSENVARDHMFFVLILSSGILSTIITNTCYGATFSYLCFMVGNFCRNFQKKKQSLSIKDSGGENFDFLFVKLLFPCFISELVKADQHVLAGFLVTKFLHTNASLSLINISESSLRSYLERQNRKRALSWEDTSFCEPLMNTITNLRGNLGNLIQSALSLLPS